MARCWRMHVYVQCFRKLACGSTRNSTGITKQGNTEPLVASRASSESQSKEDPSRQCRCGHRTESQRR